MSTEQLIIELDARTAKLDAKLKKVERNLDGVDDSTKKVDGSLKKVGKVAGVAGAAILKTAAAATALAAAISAIVVSSAKGRRQLEVLATQAKTTTADFQALAFATSTYGIDAAKVADLSKDIADRIGEFSAAGTGVFQDYADAMKLSKDEARAAAEEFKGLSSQEILGTMVSRMEDANVAGDVMLFVMESLANDASKLIPLFKGNSKELLELKKRFNDVNDSLQLTGTQAAALKDVANTFTLMTATMGNASTAISATLAPVFDDFFNDIIEIVPDATQTIIDFVNSFLDAENITSIAGVTKEIAASNKEIAMQKGIIDKGLNPRATKAAERILKAEKERKEELEAQLAVLQEQEKSLENAKRLKGGQIGGEDGADLPEGGLGTGDEIQAIADRFKSEEILLAEKLNRELKAVGDNDELKKQLAEKFAEDIKEIRDKAEEAFNEETQTKDEAEIEALVEKQARLQQHLQDKLISEQDYQEKLKEIIGEYAPETLDPSILEEKNQTELDLLNDKLDQKLISHESYFRSLKKLQDKDEDDKEKNKDTELKWSTSSNKKLMDDGTALLTSLGNNSKTAHKIKQGLAASNAFMNTAEGVTDALAEQNYPSAALIAATGAVQIAAILSSSPNSPGGSSVSTPSSAPASQQQPDFQPETSSLEFTDTTDTGQTTFNLTVPDGDEIGQALANWINKAQTEGRT